MEVEVASLSQDLTKFVTIWPQECQRAGSDQILGILSSETQIGDESQNEALNRAILWGLGSIKGCQSVEEASRAGGPIFSQKNDHFQGRV